MNDMRGTVTFTVHFNKCQESAAAEAAHIHQEKPGVYTSVEDCVTCESESDHMHRNRL